MSAPVNECGDCFACCRALPIIQAELQKKAADVPEHHRKAGDGFNFIVIGGELAVSRPAFADYVRTLVSRGVAVYLSAETPKTLINAYLEKLAAMRDMPGMTAMLLHIYRPHLEQKKLMRQAEGAAHEAPGP